MSNKKMSNWNGYEIVDSNARKRLEDMEKQGVGGASTVVVEVGYDAEMDIATASHTANEIYELVQGGATVVAVVNGENRYPYKRAFLNTEGKAYYVEFSFTEVGEQEDNVTTYGVSIDESKDAVIWYNELLGGNGSGGDVSTGAMQAAIAAAIQEHNEQIQVHPNRLDQMAAELVAIKQTVSAIPKFKIEVVTVHPTITEASTTTVYLVPSGGADGNLYTEWICVEKDGARTWEKLGTQNLDLTGYVTDEELSAAVAQALLIAKESGEFKGETGATGPRGPQGPAYTLTEDDKALIVAEVTERIDGESIPSFWQTAVDACVSKIKALQVGRNCVTFPFFSDNHTRDGKTQYMGILIAHVMKECGIPYCFYGGDAITSALAQTADSDAEFKAQARAFFAAMSYIPDGRFCMALGNHEGYLKQNTNIEGSTTVTYDRNQTYDIFLRGEGVTQNKHFGGDGTYYYVDDIASKVRWVVLNTNGIGNSNIDSTQISWFENTALKFNESGWGVVIISHIPITNHYEQSNIGNNTAVISTLQSYINGEDENKADIIGWFSGHIHRDRIYTGVSVNDTDDSEGDSLGFTQVTITSDHTTIAYPIGNSPTYHPVQDDDQSHAIDFVTINKNTKTVNITRLGIGSDRSFTYGEAEIPSITNFADPSDQYWLNGYRLNSSLVTNSNVREDMVTTNYIDTALDDIVVVKNLNMDTTSAEGGEGAVSSFASIEQSPPSSRDKTRESSRFVSEVDGVYTFTGVVGYLRFCGVPTNGGENVIINIQRNGVWL